MIGLRTGTWRFVVEAPGFLRLDVQRAGAGGQHRRRCSSRWRAIPGPMPNALDRNIQQRLQEAATLRDAGQLDQALAAYQDIHAKNPKLTSVNLVMADVYRRKAAQATDGGRAPGLIDRALEAYDEVLKTDAGNERARTERRAPAPGPARTSNASQVGCRPASRIRTRRWQAIAHHRRGWRAGGRRRRRRAGGTRASRRRTRAPSSSSPSTACRAAALAVVRRPARATTPADRRAGGRGRDLRRAPTRTRRRCCRATPRC